VKHRLLFVIVLATVAALAAAPAAFASRDDSVMRTPWFGPLLMGPTTSIFAGDFSLSVESEVRLQTGIYTYLYKLTGSNALEAINTLNVSGNWGSSGALNWGIITSESSNSAVSFDPRPGDVAFGAGMLTANLSNGPRLAAVPGGDSANGAGGLDVGETFVFYAQSTIGPASLSAGALALSLEADAFGLAFGPMILEVVPEPSSAALISSALLGIFALTARKRKLAAAG
jgi:hypothetical protein